MQAHLLAIHAHCRRLNRRHALMALFLCLADWALVWLAVAGLNRWIDPLREGTTALLLLLSLLLVPPLWALAYARTRLLFRTDPRSMARRIERANPQLNDLLTTAADLETRPTRLGNALESLVLESASRQLTRLSWKAQATHPLERRSSLVGIAVLALLLSVWASSTVPTRKAVHFLNDAWHGAPTGLLLSAHRPDLPEGSTLTVDVEVRRWEQLAWIRWEDAHGSGREPIVMGADGTGRFTFYSLQETFRYHVETPSLRSSTRTVEVYEPARLDALRLEARPPAYTGLPVQLFERLGDLKLVEGTTVQITAQSQAAVRVDLVIAEQPLPLETPGPGQFGGRFTAKASAPYHFQLEDAMGRQETSPAHQLTVIPDNPPTVEVLEPRQDSVLAPDQVFGLELYAADDFGLAAGRLHLALSGSDPRVVAIPLDDPAEDGPLTEVHEQTAVSLADLQAGEGEFLALYVEVEDNREPIPNRTRSDLLFIELRTPVPPEEMEGMPMEQEEINLRELIDEQKRLLRETHRLALLPPAAREAQMAQLAASLSVLGVEINRLFSELRGVLLEEQRADLIGLFEQSLQANRDAIEALGSGQASASFAPQSASLSALLKLENAFRRNIRSKNPTEGKSGGESSEESEPSEAGETGEETVPLGDQLQAAKAALQELVGAQNQLNATYERASGSTLTAAEAKTMATAQTRLAEKARELDRDLRSMRETRAVRDPLSEARQQMSTAASSAGQEDARGALRSGLRAREGLRQAAAELEALLAEVASQELEAAAQLARRLAEQQQAAAEASTAAAASPETANLSALEGDQRALQARYDAFLRALAERGRQIAASTSPEAGQSLMEAAASSRAGPTGSSMERAANALLYGQPDMAQPLQTSAAAGLAGLADQLSEARSQLSRNPVNRARAIGRELSATLEELASYARDAELAPENRLPEIRDKWAQRLEELREISGDPRFGSLSGQLGRAQPGTWEGELAQARSVLLDGARLLQQFLFDEASLHGVQMNRQAAPPPDAYRQMVEEYFRRLANEPSSDP